MRLLDLRVTVDLEWLWGRGGELREMAEGLLVDGGRNDAHVVRQVDSMLQGGDRRVVVRLGEGGEVEGMAVAQRMERARRGIQQYRMGLVMVREEARGRGIGGTLVRSLVQLVRVETRGVFGVVADLPGCLRGGGAGLYSRLGWKDREGEGWQLEEEDRGWGLLTSLGKRVAEVVGLGDRRRDDKRLRQGIEVWNDLASGARERVAPGWGGGGGRGDLEVQGAWALGRIRRVWEGGLEDSVTGKRKQRLVKGETVDERRRNWEEWVKRAKRARRDLGPSERGKTREERAVGTFLQEPD